MPVSPKKIFSMIAAAVALVVVLLSVILSRFDAAEVERSLARLAEENDQRVLRLEGGARLALFPRPAVVLERGTLSGPGGAMAFAAFDEARLNLAWSGLLGGPQRVTGVVLRGLRAEVAAAGAIAGTLESGPLHFEIGEVALESADLRFGPADDNLLHLDRAVVRFDGAAVDAEGSGAGLGLKDLALRVQSAPAGNARNLAFVINGLYGAEKFDLRLTAGALRRQPEGFNAEDVNLVMQLWRDDDGFDVALRTPSLAGGLETARAEQAVLAVTHAWKNGRLTLNYGGAASLGLAGGWLEWPDVRLEVNLYEAGKGELTSRWGGATRFEAATARPGLK
jgi:hypothetical protein